MTPRAPSPRSPGIVTFCIGLFLVLVYWGLSTAEIGGIGADTDIGGGLILLVGYIFMLVGLIIALRAWLSQRSRRP